MILGDDVVIYDSAVGERYKDLITRLGVSISHTKSVSLQGALLRCEFASKLVSNGIDISPLPLGLLFQYKSEDLFKFLLAFMERGHYHGGAALSENLLECISNWLGWMPYKDSDFKAPEIREDLLSFIGFYAGYSSYLKIRRKLGVTQGEKLEKEHATYVDSLFSGSSLGLFLSGVPFSFWVKVHNLLNKGALKTLKINIFTIRKIVRDPSLFIKRICKNTKIRVQLRDFLLSDRSKSMINLLNSPYYEVYINIYRKFFSAIKLESLRGTHVVGIHPEYKTIQFPTKDQVYSYFLSKDLSPSLLSTIDDINLIDDITKLAIGPKILVKEFRKNFLETTSRCNTLTHIRGEVRIEISSLFHTLCRLGYYSSYSKKKKVLLKRKSQNRSYNFRKKMKTR